MNNIESLGDRQRVTNKDNVYKILKNAIQFLELKPGSTISETELITKLKVSRTPIREALIRLSDELLVEIYPQRGTYVSKINLSLAKEMAYMRHILETEICLKMCREKVKISDYVDEKLYLLNLALKRHDAIEYILKDDEFHRAIFSYGKHEIIWNIISNTRAHYIRVLVLDMMLPNSLEKSYQDHLKIVECIENGDENGLIDVFDVHHDHKNSEREEQIKNMYPEYFV